MQQQNPYAPPQTADRGINLPASPQWPTDLAGLWRDGDWLVSRRNVDFPLVCPATNQPAATRAVAYFPWARKDLYPMRFGAVVGILYFLTQVKHMVLNVPITAADARRRFWRLFVGTLSGIAAIILIGVLFYVTTTQAQQPRKPGQTFLEQEGKVLAVTGAAFSCIVTMALVLHGMPDPTKKLFVHGVHGECIWLSGAHPDYLSRLPTYSGQRPQGT